MKQIIVFSKCTELFNIMKICFSLTKRKKNLGTFGLKYFWVVHIESVQSMLLLLSFIKINSPYLPTWRNYVPKTSWEHPRKTPWCPQDVTYMVLYVTKRDTSTTGRPWKVLRTSIFPDFNCILDISLPM